MPDSTRARTRAKLSAAGNPVPGAPGRAVRPGLRVLAHEPVCPQCGSFDVDTAEVDTGDGFTETAWICQPCGCAWPLACVCEWGTGHERP